MKNFLLTIEDKYNNGKIWNISEYQKIISEDIVIEEIKKIISFKERDYQYDKTFYKIITDIKLLNT